MSDTVAPPDPNLRFRWVDDDEPYDYGDLPPDQMGTAVKAVEKYGNMGCILERRCGGCGEWHQVDSLWGIVGDDSYREDVEANMLAEHPPTEIDYARLNAGAQVLYEAARAKGRREGYDERMEESIRHVGASNLEVVDLALGFALAAVDDDAARRLGQVAQSLLNKTPVAVAGVDQATRLLSEACLVKGHGFELNRDKLRAALDVVEEARR